MDRQELWGVLIEIFLADSLTVLGLTGQKLAAMRYRVTHDLSDVKVSQLLKSPLWIASLVTFLIGNVLETVALGFASQGSIVAAGNLTIFWNAVFAVLFFAEPFTVYPPYPELSLRIFKKWDLFSYSILLAGSIVTVLSCPLPQDDTTMTAEELIHKWVESPYCFFAASLLLIIFVCAGFLIKYWKNPKVGNWNAAMNACLCACIGSFTLTMSKVTTTLLKNTQWNHVDAWAMIACYVTLLVLQLYLLNVALAVFEQALFVPIYTAFGTIVTTIAGLLYWKTYVEFTAGQFYLFCGGMAFMCWGILLIAHRDPQSEKTVAQNFRTSRGASVFEEDTFVNLPFLLGRTAHSSEPDLLSLPFGLEESSTTASSSSLLEPLAGTPEPEQPTVT